MNWLSWIREHAAHLLFRNRKTEEIRRINRLARTRASMNSNELEDNTKQLASTLLNIHLESQSRNEELYKRMAPHVRCVWNTRQLAFLRETLQISAFPGESELSTVFESGRDIKKDVLKTSFFDKLSPEEYEVINRNKKDNDTEFRPGKPSKTADHARGDGAEETWRTWKSKFLNHFSIANNNGEPRSPCSSG